MVVYAVIFLLIDLAYLAFERAVLTQADQSLISERVRTWTQRRTLLAVLVFAAGAAIAPFMPLLGFATVCCALLLYLRPEAISGLAKQIKS
ncbi:putative membrane protein [Bradyrhizobium sp. USDA 4501]